MYVCIAVSDIPSSRYLREMYPAFPLSLEQLQAFQSIQPLIFNSKILKELILKVQEGSSANSNGNHKGQHAELGECTLRSIQQEPTKRELLPKPPLSLGGRTSV